MSGGPIPEYHRAPYTSTLEADLLDAGVDTSGAWVETSDTIVYPGGGGQPPDHGWVDGLDVLRVTWTGRGWRHDLRSRDSVASVGRVGIAIDWARRFDHMQQHTAQHVISALAEDRWGWATTAFHLGADRSDVELAAPSLSRDQLESLEEAVMAVVRDALPVSTRYVSVPEYRALRTRSRGLPEGHEGDVRLVEIGAVDLVDVTACGGTHLASTSHVESVKLLGTESMRRGTRLHWVAGARLRARLGAHEARSEALRKVLGVGDDQLIVQAQAKLEALKEADQHAQWLEGRLAQEAAARIVSGPGDVLEGDFDRVEAAFLRMVAQRLQDSLGSRVALLTARAAGGAAFLVVAGAEAPIDVRATGQRVAELLEGRGGGAGRIFQGRAASLARREEAVELLAEDLGRT